MNVFLSRISQQEINYDRFKNSRIFRVLPSVIFLRHVLRKRERERATVKWII
jgi:hypothetical protein